MPPGFVLSEKNTKREVVAVPRARSPDSIEAEKLFHDGMALVDIAKKLGKPEGTVRRWKSTQKWEESSKKKKANVRKRKRRRKRTLANEVDSLEIKIAKANRMQKDMELHLEHRML